ncbi:TRAP transporter substrate-binding protein [Desmospora activa]|uniref:Tripartite ATP-independent transporter DctP family solute receptor n=1 Tax=Desmospora activa DSM 45169 TaxID=1121389 RepID=A0A2T4ZCD3_9BACL|nr:TRAP transporter substrate-binding protein [Desmospora activa]PTM59560.1 tripartite ATP-independent transporter DctP family solute receptor [Desmospora activa DSM 45169]
MRRLGFLALITMLIISGCGAQGVATSTTKKTITIAHNLNDQHPVHKGLERFSEEVEKRTNGSLSVKIYANGVLGSERDALEQLKRGGIDMTKVSAGQLESFSPSYRVFSLPYLFENQEHFYRAMQLPEIQQLYQSTEDQGYIALTFYDAGARSFYSNRPIQTPDDLKGMKIRIQESLAAAELIKQLGASPTPMAFGETYTGLQQGVIDGAENNETALTSSKHGEVSKIFAVTEHTRIPDMLLISTKTWNELSDDQKEAVSQAAKISTEYQKELWQEAIQLSIQEAEKSMDVRFINVDKEPFRQKLEPMVERYRQSDPLARDVIDAVENLKGEENSE